MIQMSLNPKFEKDWKTLKSWYFFNGSMSSSPIMDLCKERVHMPVTWLEKRWWVQEGKDLEGQRPAVAAAEEERGVEDPGREEVEQRKTKDMYKQSIN